MSKIIPILMILCCAVFVQTASLADYTVTTEEPLQPNYYTNYSNYNQGVNPYYSQAQGVNQPYYQVQNSSQYPNQYINPYTNPYANQYQNSCRYPSGYGYGNYGNSVSQAPFSILNPVLSNTANSGVKSQIARSVGRNLLYSMMRGY